MRNNLFLLVDIIFYLVIPLVLWEFGRPMIGDYLCMVLSSIPGVIYGTLRFISSGFLNFSSIYLILNMAAGTLTDLFSKTASHLLWNNIYYSIILTMIFLGSSLIKRPLFLYFSLDLLTSQGNDRKLTKELFFQREILTLLNRVTLIFGLGELLYSLIMAKLVKLYGVEAFETGILMEQALNLLFSVISITGLYILYNRVDRIVSIKKPSNPTVTRKHYLIKFNKGWFLLEKSYFFFGNQNR